MFMGSGQIDQEVSSLEYLLSLVESVAGISQHHGVFWVAALQ